jgi:hypothetical protein
MVAMLCCFKIGVLNFTCGTLADVAHVSLNLSCFQLAALNALGHLLCRFYLFDSTGLGAKLLPFGSSFITWSTV